MQGGNRREIRRRRETKRYQVTKIDSITEIETNYGINSEENVKLITRGYKQDKLLPEMYSRKGSRYFFIVEELVECW